MFHFLKLYILRKKLVLNDFESFDKFLCYQSKFKSNTIYWPYYYLFAQDKFYPPIPKPKTIVDYQLNHYALWMVIHVFGLHNKPTLIYHKKYKLTSSCYACAYANIHEQAGHISCEACPINGKNSKSCCDAYYNWVRFSKRFSGAYDELKMAEYAKDVARLKWTE